MVTEDKRFYDHHGVDWFRFFGALWANFRHGGVAQGLSTITMQLARNLFPEDISGQDRTIRRKLREVQVAYDIERNFPKDKILEFYLNQIDLGNRAYGVESASQRYFGKSVRDLNVAEAATLAALPKAPSRYNPRKNPDLAVYRRNIILTLMEEAGLLSKPDAERWKSYPLVLSSRSDFSEVAPYFIEYVRQQLDTRFGPDLYTNGLRIYTTIDLDMQQAAERALTQQLDAIESGTYGEYEHPTYSQYIEKREDQSESPVPTPYCRAWRLPSKRRPAPSARWSEAGTSTTASSIGPLRRHGSPGPPSSPSYTRRRSGWYPWSTIMVDDPISVEMRPGEPPWEPANYDNKFEGAMTLREALYKSRNIIAIKLGMEIGPQAVIGEAARFGLTTNIPPYPSIYIGSADVIPLEIISAYSAFATLGTRTTPYAIERVEDRAGNTVWAPKPRSAVMPRRRLAHGGRDA